MRIEGVGFCVADFRQLALVEQPGEIGTASFRSFECGNIRVRIVEYSPGYVADHWCERGHVFLVLQGEVVVHLRAGRAVPLKSEMSFQVADGGEAHRIATATGARVAIVD